MSNVSPCEKCESKRDGRCKLERMWIDCSAKDAYEKRMKARKWKENRTMKNDLGGCFG